MCRRGGLPGSGGTEGEGDCLVGEGDEECEVGGRCGEAAEV